MAVNGVLLLASRDAPKERPDWIDSVKATLSDFAELSDRTPLSPPSADERRRREHAQMPQSMRDRDSVSGPAGPVGRRPTTGSSPFRTDLPNR